MGGPASVSALRDQRRRRPRRLVFAFDHAGNGTVAGGFHCMRHIKDGLSIAAAGLMVRCGGFPPTGSRCAGMPFRQFHHMDVTAPLFHRS